MRRLRCFYLFAFTFFSVVRVAAVTPAQPEFRKLADGVYVYIGKLNDANAMVIVTTQGVVLVDTGNSQPETRNILKQIQAVTQQPIRYVVITQNHGDHIGGTPLFSPPATVILHEKVARQWAQWKPYQLNTWRKLFPERAEVLKNFNPMEAVLSFRDHITLHLGDKTIELMYADDPYNPGDVMVWLPQYGVLHGSMAAYKERHPDIRPDYSHGTTWGLLKQLEAMIPLQPKFVIPAHGPVGDATDLQAMVDYLLTARQKVRSMMEHGASLDSIRKEFNMNEYKGWDRTIHLPVMAAAIYRELKGDGPEVIPVIEKQVRARITKIAEEGRYLTVVSDTAQELALRVSNVSDMEGVADRTELKIGMRISALYQEQKEWNDVLQLQVER